MKSSSFLLLLLLLSFDSRASRADTLYSTACGNPRRPAIIFLHGGPGYNAYSFEESTADSLAKRGFYVIVYDQRGSGRSESYKGKYTYNESVEDLRSVYDRYHLKKATLMGHSWGGAIATLFAARYPERVRSMILVSAPLSFQRTLHTIMQNYVIKFPDTSSMEHVEWEIVNGLDPASFQYSSGAFRLAMTGGFYRTKEPNERAKALWNDIGADDTAHWSSHMSFPPVLGLFKNEHYTLLDITDTLKHLSKQIPVFGIYGDEDGLFDPAERDHIRMVIGPNHMSVVQGASHNVFIDQQAEFLDRVAADLKTN